jgi:hypothetical protein
VSRIAKIAYFFIAIVTMACFAFASVLMAENHPGWATLLFVLAIVITGAGFVTKARLVHK